MVNRKVLIIELVLVQPAIEKEIPETGACHCGIFCTPEFAAAKRIELGMEEIVHTHSRGLN